MTGELAVIFDLDGTLIDSAPDLRAALNRVLATRGMRALSAEAVRSMIGDGAKALVERAWAAQGAQAGAIDLADFLADYEANSTVETRMFPGMAKALEQLAGAGHKLAICTNKPVTATGIILQSLGLQALFPVVIGGGSTPYRKPDPRHLAGAVTALRAAKAVMIGDHENDIKAADRLGLASIFVTWGYGTAKGTFTADDPSELPGIIAGL